ncbi:MAG: histone deacetylase family protein [Azospirillaceae bacterium]
MKIVINPDHEAHAPETELTGGGIAPAVEIPARARTILKALEVAGHRDIAPFTDHGRAVIERAHPPAYLDFLAAAHGDWTRVYGDSHAVPFVWPVRSLRQVIPRAIDARLGHYSGDGGTPITAGTWQAAYGSAQTAVTGARALTAAGPASTPVFALCRPPGHHAASDLYMGYCFLNNAAIAAEDLLAAGAGRVSVLDVDYHHGNGTQAIFYHRGEMQFVSLHADPADEYPYFLGYADETGEGAGEGTTLNLPLPWGTDWEAYAQALDRACAAIDRFGPDALVVSLGCDTYKEDPISRFRLETEDFTRMGARIGRLGRPTLVVMEGGYAVDALGANVAAFLKGLAGG